jgi:hypothetical protein
MTEINNLEKKTRLTRLLPQSPRHQRPRPLQGGAATPSELGLVPAASKLGLVWAQTPRPQFLRRPTDSPASCSRHADSLGAVIPKRETPEVTGGARIGHALRGQCFRGRGRGSGSGRSPSAARCLSG